MGNYYGLPSSGNVHLSDSNTPDFQYGYEKAATFSFALAAGMEMWGVVGYSAAGHMGTNPGVSSLEGLVLDNECFGYMSRILKGIDVTEETLALDVIKNVGIGGNFLAHDHTAKHFRDQLWDPDVFVRESYSDWFSKGRNTAVNNTIKITQEIIDKNWPCEPAIDNTVKKELDKIFEKAGRDLAGL
jgi:trimethylamine--corrinoid protein Co-methyltransferase